MTVNFSGNVTTKPMCEYPGCDKAAIIPVQTAESGKFKCYCYRCSLKLEEEERKRKLREEILEMKKEGLI